MTNRLAVLSLFLVGCSPEVDVVESAPVAPLDNRSLPAPSLQLVYFDPLPFPPTHAVRTSFVPSTAQTLHTVQAVDVEVVVEGGAYGTRQIAVVFVSPLGLTWERQTALIETQRGSSRQVARFSLPVAATFIEDQQLDGMWRVTTLDENVEKATTTFVLGE